MILEKAPAPEAGRAPSSASFVPRLPLAAALAFLAVLALAGCDRSAATATSAVQGAAADPAQAAARSADAAGGAAVAVRTAVAVLRPFTLEAEYSARIAASREVNVVPKVGGRVASVRATTGDKVAAGALLFTLETADYETQLRQANAVLQSANATMTRTSDAGQGQQLIQAQAQVDAAQVNYDNAKGLYDKTKRLYDQGVVAKQQLDDVESRFKAAGFQLDSARQSLGLVRDKAGSQASDVVAGQVNQARAQVDFARSQLEATRVRSPLAGKISYRNVEVGELVGPTTLAFIVMDDRTVLAEAGVSERVVGNLRPGMEVKVLVDALGSSGGGMETASLVPVAGTIDSVSPSADPRTMLYLLRVRIDNKEGRLKPGMLAKLHIPVSSSASALLIPEKAAFSAKGGDSVYVVADGRVSLRPVSLGESDGDSVEVLSGLKPGELVVTEAQEFLSEGQRVVTAGG